MNEEPQNICMEYVPTLKERITSKLFPSNFCHLPDPDEPPNAWPVNDCLVVRTVVHLSFLDRLRVLLTGRVFVECKTISENRLGRNKTASCAYPLPFEWMEGR